MDTIACIKHRRSIRLFHDRPVEHSLIREMVDCARWAPSWSNCKAVRYTVVEDPEMLRTISETLAAPENVHIIGNTPALFVLSTVKNRSGYERDGTTSTAKGDAWQMFDAGAACENLCLAATELGLGTVIMASFDEDGVTRLIGLPDDELIIALVAFGYPAMEPKAPRRKEVDEILRFC